MYGESDMNQKDFKSALIGKTVPLLILDQKWHRLFAVHGKTDEIKALESKLHNLLTEQSRLNTRLKELKRLKGKLLDEIVQNMEENEKKVEENKRLVDEVNEKLDECEEHLVDIPYRMVLCYLENSKHGKDSVQTKLLSWLSSLEFCESYTRNASQSRNVI